MFPTNRKWIIVACALLTAAVLCPAQDADQAPAPYHDKVNGFTIMPPPGWVTSQADETQVFFNSPPDGDDDPFSENINIIITPIPDDEEAELPTDEAVIRDDLAEILAALSADVEDAAVPEADDVEINGVEAIRIVFSFTMQGTAVKSVQYVLIHDGTLFTITGTALPDTYDTYIAAIDAAVNSMKVGLPTQAVNREAREGEYYSEAHAFSVIGPAEWDAEEELSDDVFLLTFSGSIGDAEESVGVINIASSAADGPLALADFAEGAIEGITGSLDNVTVLETTSPEIAGQASRRFLADAETEGVPVKVLAYCFTQGHQGYVVTFMVFPRDAFEQYLPQFDKVVGSFRME